MLQDLYDSFIATLTSKTDAVAASMSGALTAPLTAAMTLYIILYGIAIMRGAIQEPVLDFAIRGIKLAIIWSLVSSAGDYTSWVSSTITTGSDQFVNAVTGGSGTIPGDSVMVQANEFSTKLEEAHAAEGWTGRIVGGIKAFVIMITAAFFAVIAFVVSLISTFALAIMAAIGPIFICFALFDATRGWFFAWLGQMLNFVLVKILVLVLTVIVVGMIGDVYTQASAQDIIGSYIAFLIVLGLAIFFFLLLPSIAAGLSAGAQASTGMLQRSIERNLGIPTGGGSGGSRGSATRK